jgi:tetratricopeptide (TPR) repeat protein
MSTGFDSCVKTKLAARLPYSTIILATIGACLIGITAMTRDRILPVLRQYIRIHASGDDCLYDEAEAHVWHQRGHAYLHTQNADAVFECFRNAVGFDDGQSAYHQDSGNFLILYRKDACRILGADEPDVISLALREIRQAVELKPDDFQIARDYAITFSLLPSTWSGEARLAWENAKSMAKTDFDREEIELNLARLDIVQERFSDAEHRLRNVMLETNQPMREILYRRLVRERRSPRQTPALPMRPVWRTDLVTKL